MALVKIRDAGYRLPEALLEELGTIYTLEKAIEASKSVFATLFKCDFWLYAFQLLPLLDFFVLPLGSNSRWRVCSNAAS